MFLSHIEILGLIKPEADTNILKKFSLQSRITIISEVVKSLQKDSSQNEILPTSAHVKWALECLGQAFALPIDNADIIESAVDLYRQWLLGPPTQRPVGLKENEAHFFKEMFLHMSLLFEPRDYSSNEKFTTHIKLCRAVLTVYLSVGQKMGRTMPASTWEAWLKALLGIMDSLVTRKSTSELFNLMNELGPFTLQVLFEMWFLSETQNMSLWQSLQDLAKNWITIPTILQWNAMCYGLTRATLFRLFGPDFGAPNIIVDLSSSYDVGALVLKFSKYPMSFDDKTTGKTIVNLNTELTYYYWHQILHILGSPNAFKDPEIFRIEFSGIVILVDLYLDLIKTTATQLGANRPSGNTILRIFGDWLFEAVLLDRSGFEEGTALACATLCKIYCSSGDRKFLPSYLSTFANCLTKVLSKDINDKVLTAALLNCRTLFIQQLEGLNLLIPHFIYAISRVWSKDGPEANVRGACIDIISTILSFHSHFQNSKFVTQKIHEITYPKDDENMPKAPSEIKAYSHIEPHLKSILLRGLSTEDSSRNLQKIMWCLHALFVESCNILKSHSTSPLEAKLSIEESRYVHYVITKVLNNVVNGSWSSDVIQTSLHLLSCLTLLYSSVENRNKLLNEVIEALCGYAVKLIAKRGECITQPQLEENEKLVIGVYQTIADWLVVARWTEQGMPQNLLECLISAIVAGINKESQSSSGRTKEPDREVETDTDSPKFVKFVPQLLMPVDKIKDAAEALLHTLVNVCGRYPQENGPHTLTSELTEDDILTFIKNNYSKFQQEKPRTHQFVRWFLLDDEIILSVLDVPLVPSKGGDADAVVVLVVRDKTGRYVWITEMKTIEKVKAHKEQAQLLRPPEDPRAHRSDSEGDWDSDYGCDDDDDLTSGTEEDDLTAVADKIVTEPIVSMPLYDSPEDTRDYADIQSFLEKKKAIKENVSNVLAYIEKERDYLKGKSYGMDCKIAFEEPKKKDIYAGDCKFQYARIFLAHLGLLNPETITRVATLDNSPSFIQEIKLLDSLPMRDVLQVGIFYVDQGQRTAYEVYSNTGGSRDYCEFLAQVGWPVDLSIHTGFKGELVSQHSGDVALYYANYNVEMIFAVATLIPLMSSEHRTVDEDSIAELIEIKKRLLLLSNILVIWINDIEDYRPKLFELSESVVRHESSRDSPTAADQLATHSSATSLPTLGTPSSSTSTSTSTPTSTSTSAMTPTTTATPTNPVAPQNDANNSCDLSEKTSPSSHSSLDVRTVLDPKKTFGKSNSAEKLEKGMLATKLPPIERKSRHTSVKRVPPVNTAAASKDINLRSLAAKTRIHILITPLQNGLFRLRTLIDGRPLMIGPILDNMVVSRYLLGDLVRRTAYYAYHFINSSTAADYTYENPCTIRQRQIEKIAQKYKNELTLEEFYNNIFTKKISISRTRSLPKIHPRSVSMELSGTVDNNSNQPLQGKDENKITSSSNFGQLPEVLNEPTRHKVKIPKSSASKDERKERSEKKEKKGASIKKYQEKSSTKEAAPKSKKIDK